MDLKTELVKRRIPQVRMATELNISPSRLSGIVNGWFMPTKEQKQRIASYLNLPVEKVFRDAKK